MKCGRGLYGSRISSVGSAVWLMVDRHRLGFVRVGAPAENEGAAGGGGGQAEGGGLGAGLGGGWSEGIVLGDAAGEDLAGGPFSAAIVGGVEGVEEFASGTADRDLKLLVEDPREIGMTTNLTLELELRNLQQSGGLGKIALGDVDRGGAFVGIERKRWRPFRPAGKTEVE